MADYPLRMYHPTLAPPDNECEAANADQAGVYAESGWLEVPAPADAQPGYAPEPVSYVQDDDGNWAPKTTEPPAKATRASKSSKSTS